MTQAEPHVWGTAPDFVGPRHALREGLLLGLLAPSPGMRVLDVGAGQGTLSRRLLARGVDVLPVDRSDQAVEVLRTRVTPEARRVDAEALPFPDDSFDAVVLGEVLEHLDDDAAALREAARVVHGGGVVVLSVPRARGAPGISDDWAGHRRRYTRARLLETVDAAGLVVEVCRAWGFPVARLYHRHVYEPYLRASGAVRPGGWRRHAVPLLRLALQVDRAFVGVERGSLGYLLRARVP